MTLTMAPLMISLTTVFLVVPYILGTDGPLKVPSLAEKETPSGANPAPTTDVLRNECTVTTNIVNCSGLELEMFPDDILMRTTALDLSNNQLASLQGIQVLPKLVRLQAHSNRLPDTEGVFLNRRFPQLEDLDLSDNEITVLPNNIPKTLKKLDVSRNKIKSLLLLDLDMIEELYLRENLFEGTLSVCNVHRIGSGCRQVVALKKLDLSKNLIGDLEENGLSGLETLQVLSLADNKLSELNKRMFTGISLSFLDLSRNEISIVADDTFQHMHTLKFLYLRSNKLVVIPSKLPLLEWFDASYNEIKTVNETLKTALYPIEMANLGHNPFHCDCHLLWLKEWYDRREYIIDYSDDINPDDYIPMCATPTELFGEHWSMLADEVFRCDVMEDARSLPPARGPTSDAGAPIPDDLALDPYAIIGENPKYIQTYDLHVQVRSVQATTVSLEWRAPSHYTNLVIQYFKSQSEVETTLFSQVQASQGHFVLKNLESHSLYMICVMPKTEMLSLSAPLDDCIQVKTQKNIAEQPQSFFEGMFSFHIDHTLESKFKLIFGCFFVSIVVVASGLLLAEGVLRLFPKAYLESDTEKEHDD